MPQPSSAAAPKVRRALLSLSEKSNLAELGARLYALGVEIIATGGTAEALRAAKIPVTAVEDITKFPACFGGRVKTLHPAIAGGLLFRRGHDEDEREAKKLGIQAIDLLIVNLYPFDEAAARGASLAELTELIDVGGPTMLRAAAKNHESVTVVCDIADMPRVLAEIERGGGASDALRRELAAKVFLRTAAYDASIAEAFSGGKHRGVLLTDCRDLRYGENPHQWGKFCEKVSGTFHEGFLTPLRKHQGKELSYLNILDADAAWAMAREFHEPTAVFVKHANPSGVASHKDLAEAFQRAYDADRVSAFGIIIAINRPCSEEIAKKIIDQKIFVEVLVAPSYEAGALELLKQKSKVRVIERDQGSGIGDQDGHTECRSAFGGILIQEGDTRKVTETDLTVVTKKKPTPEQIRDLLFAFTVVKHAKSNAIVFAKDSVTVGIGCGQTSRVDATFLAVRRAGPRASDAAMASDAFFPFPDAMEEAAKAGISAVIHPGGSVRDQEVIAKADELGLAMVVTGVRAFRH